MSNESDSTTSNSFGDLGLSCPFGGDFYICVESTAEFVGCCTSDPCTDQQRGICPTSNLRNSSFNADAYLRITPQSCGSDNGDWYTCTGTSPPFLGCCSINPCQEDGCPVSNVIPAELSDNFDYRSTFLAAAGTTPTGSSPSSTSSATAGTATSAGSDSTPSSSSNHSSDGIGTGAVVGIVVGAVAVTAMIIGFFIWWMKRRARGATQNTREGGASTAFLSSASPTQNFVHPNSTPPVPNMQSVTMPPNYQVAAMYPGAGSPTMMVPPGQMTYPDPNAMHNAGHDIYGAPRGPFSSNGTSQYGHQSVSSFGTDYTSGQRTSDVSQLSGQLGGQPSPGFVSNMPPLTELDATVSAATPQEMAEPAKPTDEAKRI
ncbi:hypothetical protein BROUX41_000570 [Berkeleyomyces rouxiae]|uniref:uncharacterized protein n=1 Tax=Berkeleyomyces rouxiae TaxID=2035830 RepID=UPI003B77760F